MADSPSTKPAPPSKRPTLLPQAEHAGKPAMPLGAHQFTLIGSRNRAHLHLLSSTISRNHACLITTRSGVYVRDLASRNGVIVNGRKVRESELQDGDLMQVGSFKFKFQEPPGPIRLGATPPAPLAMLEMDGRALTPLEERTVLIGRRPGCDITLDSPAVSNTHAVIFECDGKRYIRDLGSRTGTQVNGKAVHQQALELGDQIKVGSTTLRYIAADLPAVEDGQSLELEPAAAHEEVHAPVDLHFEQPATAETPPPAHAFEPEAEPIPLVEPAAEHLEPGASEPAEPVGELDFAPEPLPQPQTEPAASRPAEEPLPLPVEEEIPLVQQEVMAPEPIVAEAAEDLTTDAWTPEPEQTVTADTAAIEPAISDDEPFAFEPQPIAPDEAPAASLELSPQEDLSFESVPEPVSTPAEPAAITESLPELPTDDFPVSVDITPQSPAVELPTGQPKVLDFPVAEHLQEPQTEASEFNADVTTPIAEPEAVIEPIVERALPVESEDLTPLPAEPEASPDETERLAVEPDLAEIPPTAAEDMVPEPTADSGAQVPEPPVATEEHFLNDPSAPVEEQPAPAPVTDDVRPGVETIEEPVGAVTESEPSLVIEESSPSETHAAEEMPEHVTNAEPAFSESQPLDETTPLAGEPKIEDSQDISPDTIAVDSSAPAEQPPEEIQAAIAEPAEPLEVTPASIEQIDPPTVTFSADAIETGATVDATAEVPVDATPVETARLPDLDRPAQETPVEPEVIEAPVVPEAPVEAVEPPAPAPARKGRSPRRKSGTARTRKKKTEVVAEAAATALPQDESTAQAPENTPVEIAASDVTPKASEVGYVVSEAAGAVEPASTDSTAITSDVESVALHSTDLIEAAPQEEIAPQFRATEALEGATEVNSKPIVQVAPAVVEEIAPEPSADVALEPVGELAPEPVVATTFESIESQPEAQPPVAVESEPVPAIPEPLAAIEDLASEPNRHDQAAAPQSVETPSQSHLPTDVELSEPVDLEAMAGPAEADTISAADSETSDAPLDAHSAVEELEVGQTIPEPEPVSQAWQDELGIKELEPSSNLEASASAVQEPVIPAAVDTVDFTAPPLAPVEPLLSSDEPLSRTQFEAPAAPEAEAAQPTQPSELSPSIESPEPALELVEVSELTSHIDFVTPVEDAVTSPTEAPVETIEVTEPTPDSALQIDESLLPPSEIEGPPAEPIEHPDALLSDSVFGEVVTDYASTGTGPLVEEMKAAPASIDQPPEATPETRLTSSTNLNPLDGDDLPPLELGESLGLDSESVEAAPIAEKPSAAETEELNLQTPVVTDAALAPVDLDLIAPVAIEPIETTLDLEPPAELATDLTHPTDLPSPVVEEPSFDTGLEWEEPLATQSQPEEIGLEFEGPTDEPEIDLAGAESMANELATEAIVPTASITSEPALPIAEMPSPAAIEPAAKASPPSEAPRPMRPPMNPFFGMERDMGSFIGGMPLPLGASPPPQMQVVKAPAPAIVPAPNSAAATEPASPAPASTTVAANEPVPSTQQPEDEFDFDKLFEGEEPLELFDENPEQLDKLPDSLEPISDLGIAIGEPLNRAPSATPEPAAPSVVSAPPLRSLTADASTARPKPPTTSVAVPPFAGSGRAGKAGANPFAAALGGLRPTDVFSQTAFPPLDEQAFKPQPIDIPPMTPGKTAGAALDRLPGSDSGAPPLKTDADAIASAPPPPRPVAPRPTAAMLADRPDEKRPWWKNIRVLLPLLVLLIVAAVVIIIRFFPPKTLVQGTLQIKGIEDRDLGVYARREQIQRLREELASPELVETVKQRLINQGITPGFAGSKETLASLANPSNSPYEDGRLVLQWPQEDSEDPTRMQAVLQTIYLNNKTAAEQTSQIRGQAAAASEKAKTLGVRTNALHDELKKLADQIKTSSGATAPDMLLDPNAAVQTLQLRDADLHKALDQANAEVKRRHEEWEHAQDAAQQGTAADPKIQQIRQNLASLKARLTVAQVSGGAQADPGKIFEDGLTSLENDLRIVTGSSQDRVLTSYAATARQAAGQIRSLLDAQRQDSARIEELRQQLAAHREAHLRQLFAADETLKGLLEERDAQAHRFGAASDSGYTQDAAKIRGVLDELDQKIEARRQSLATTSQSTDDLQQHLEQTIQELQDDRSDKESKITSALAQLEVPSAGKVQAQDELLVTRIGGEVSDLKVAHDQYASGAKPSADDAASQVQKLQSQIAEQQAQLDAYQQRSDSKAAVATARQALDAAQDAEAKAQAAWAANTDELTLLKRYRDQQMQYNDSTTAQETADHEAQARAAEAGATPILLPPDPLNGVRLVSQPDQRVWYLAGAIGLIVLLFAGPLWMAARQGRADLPYASIATDRSSRQHAASAEDFPLMDDDEHPALT